jgi:hypothetical protein
VPLSVFLPHCVLTGSLTVSPSLSQGHARVSSAPRALRPAPPGASSRALSSPAWHPRRASFSRAEDHHRSCSSFPLAEALSIGNPLGAREAAGIRDSPAWPGAPRSAAPVPPPRLFEPPPPPPSRPPWRTALVPRQKKTLTSAGWMDHGKLEEKSTGGSTRSDEWLCTLPTQALNSKHHTAGFHLRRVLVPRRRQDLLCALQPP